MASIEIDGANQKIKLDSDGDTFVEAATDDTIKVNVAGAEDLRITANAINVLSGTTLTIDSGATITNSGTASGFASAADDISTGDAAVTIATSTGNITIDAQGDDTDIIFKGTDGGADTTFLTIDGSAAGAAAFNAGATFGSNVTITTADNSDTLTLKSTDDDANTGPVLNLLRDSASPADADQIGRIDFSAESDLGSETNYAVIKVFSDDVSHGVEDGEFALFTRVNGSETNRMSVGSAQTVFNDGGGNLDFRVEGDTVTSLLHLDAGNDAVLIGANARTSDERFLVHSPDNQKNAVFNAADNSYAQDQLSINCHRAGTASFNFARFMSDADSGQDSEFIMNGAGSMNADGTFNANGADYAEFFETSDGNAIEIGKTVVLDGKKVRASTEEDDVSSIIGVVRPKVDGINSLMVGNTAWNRWRNKYLHDDYGRFIMEDYTVTEWKENGQTVNYVTERLPEDVTVPSDAIVKTLQRKKLNPDFDSEVEYQPRSERNEWVIVGLLGQVQVEKGQTVGDRWIKMRDISETVEEWLVR